VRKFVKKLHKELKETHDLLEIKVKKRTAELLEANEGLENEIKERKQIENTLRLEKDNFVNILNSMEDDIYIVDEQYNIEYLNTALRKHFGETQGKKCFEYFNGRKEICPWCRTHEVVEGKTVRWEWHSVKNNKTYDLISTPLKNPNGCISKMQIFRDVTTIKMLRDQLVRSERLAASGQLAASIAHEINSPLQAITFTLSAIKKKIPKEKELEDNIDLLKQEFESIRDTVKNLLDLNRPKQDKKQQININSVIRKTVILVQGRLKKEKVAIDLKLSPRIPDITASPQQLNHVFLNNINNAIEAIAGISRHKEVNIGLKIVKKIDIKSDLKDGNIVINIADNGPGISKDDLEHIFDPFYTRKKIMGLGVGLSICHDIIKDHGGTIMAKNGHNGGAVFTITLPCVKS
jgi:C4-dicarboxylate-specific signal transduction histidine kinase